MIKTILAALLFFPSVTMALPQNPMYPENISHQWLTGMNRFYHHVDIRFSPRMIRHYGASYRLEYSLGGRAIDLQGTFLLSSWDAMSVPPNQTSAETDPGGLITDPGTEVGRSRNPKDPWNQWLIELGYSYRGRLIPIEAKKWVQAARVAFGYTGIRDVNQEKSYSGFSVNVEFSMFYALNPRFQVGPKFSYRYGWAHLNGVPTSNFTRIPIASFDAALGVVF
ncbi:MAG: hypothetical protein KGP28_07120 [Bdellovibrionales bacterium]|nr:hypothetical protein [Bdellovibrionales bacterium]